MCKTEPAIVTMRSEGLKNMRRFLACHGITLELTHYLDIIVAQAKTINVGAVVVPHFAQLESHGDLVVELADEIVIKSHSASKLQCNNTYPHKCLSMLCFHSKEILLSLERMHKTSESLSADS